MLSNQDFEKHFQRHCETKLSWRKQHFDKVVDTSEQNKDLIWRTDGSSLSPRQLNNPRPQSQMLKGSAEKRLRNRSSQLEHRVKTEATPVKKTNPSNIIQSQQKPNSNNCPVDERNDLSFSPKINNRVSCNIHHFSNNISFRTLIVP